MYSAYKLNKQGDNIQPWDTPFPIWNQCVVPCPVLTVVSWPAHRFLKRQVRWSGIPISFRICHSFLWKYIGNITLIQAYAPTSNTEEAEVEWFYEDLQDLLELTSKKRCPFQYRGLECKSRKTRNTWSNRQIWPWSTKWSRSRVKANRALPRECTVHSKDPLPTTQEKTLHMDITRWSTPKSDWLYSLQPKMEKLYTVSKNKTGS